MARKTAQAQLRLPLALCLTSALLLAACSSSAPPPPVASAPPPQYDHPWGAHIAEASTRFNVPEEWIMAVMHVESRGMTHHRDGRLITSYAGAMGLMQVMPGTWAILRERYELGDNPHDPRDNILAGAAYIREMYDLFGSPGFLGAYNAGPGRYQQYLVDGRPLPRQTRRYMDIIYPQIADILPPDQTRTLSDLPHTEKPRG